MASRVARVGDPASGVCTQHKNPVNWTGVIATGCSAGSSSGSPIACIGDTGETSCGHTFQITGGSSIFSCNGNSVARKGDPVIVIGGGSGQIDDGDPFAVTE